MSRPSFLHLASFHLSPHTNAVAVHHPFTIVSNNAVLLWCWVPVNICCSLIRVRAGVLVCVCVCVCVCGWVSLCYLELLLHEMVSTVLRALRHCQTKSSLSVQHDQLHVKFMYHCAHTFYAHTHTHTHTHTQSINQSTNQLINVHLRINRYMLESIN